VNEYKTTDAAETTEATLPRKAALWQVTGYGPLAPGKAGRVYGNRVGLKTVDIEADTKEEALILALALLPADLQAEPRVTKFANLKR